LLALPAGCLRAGTWLVLGLELAFAPLALAPRLRPCAWGLMVGVQLGLLALLDFADLTLGMLVLHLVTFDPEWLPRRAAVTTEWSASSCKQGRFCSLT